jgi:CHAD domain-containing protein
MTARHPTETTRLLRERVQAVSRHLPQAIVGEVEAVHELRIACRRLRVTLALLTPKPDGRRAQRARKVLQALTRAAGPGRDLDVMLAGFSDHVNTLAKPTPALRTLKRRMLHAQRRSRRALSESLLDLDIGVLRRDLRVLLHRGAAETAACLQRIHKQTRRELGLLKASLEGLGDAPPMDRLHAARIAFRRLRYVTEIRDVLLKLDGKSLRRLRDQQRLLGEAHDASVLGLWLGAQIERDVARGQAELTAESRRQRQHFENLARAAHQEWMKGNPRALLTSLLGE